ncbi:hypothetical protein LJR225_003128 [Phenylobacterium sp. LjRoot225]|uniref:hypothetical protein n=1 Tax=Phenylobacterium sp. LjRoot225 TaxID=3342285 RepID=UPI003ECD39D0
MARYRTTILNPLPDAVLADALARMPADQHLIWNGRPCPGHPGSARALALRLINEIWEPVPLRILVSRAARLSGRSGLNPDTVRNAVRMHQSASYASYFLVRRTGLGDYVAVVDVPYPSSGGRLREGEVVLGRAGARYDGSGVLVCAVP